MHPSGKHDVFKNGKTRKNRKPQSKNASIQHASAMDLGSQYNIASKRGSAAVLRLSEGARNFATALNHPWDTFGMNFKFPVLPVLPTASYTNFNKNVTITPNAAGNFYIALLPASGMANDIICGYHNTPGSSWSPGSVIPSALDVNSQGFTVGGSPFRYADFDQASPGAVRGRLIGVGARLFYEGASLNKTGHVQFLVHPNKDPIGTCPSLGLAGVTGDGMATFRSCKVTTVQKLGPDGLIGEFTRPILSTEDQFFLESKSSFTIDGCPGWVYSGLDDNASPDRLPFMAIVGSMPPAFLAGPQTSVVLRLEVYVAFEAHGRATATSATMSIPDSSGAELVYSHHASHAHASAGPGPDRLLPKGVGSAGYIKSLMQFAKRHSTAIGSIAAAGAKLLA